MAAARILAALAVCFLTTTQAVALLDIPTSERRALAVTDLASSSGIARPADPALGPIDDVSYLESYRALKSHGLVDPLGDRLQQWADLRSDGGLHWESLVPTLTVRPYYLDADDHERTLYHSSGDTLEDGLNTFFSASGAAFWGEHLAAAYELQAQERPGDWYYRTKRLYIKGVWGKWSLKIGRDAERLGVGYHGSLLLDDNAPTMDLWRIRTEQPLFLPWGLDWIGGFRFTLFNGYLSDSNPDAPDRRYTQRPGSPPIADPRLLGMRLSYHPTSWLDLAFSRSILYGGKGRETYDTPKDWWELFTAKDENTAAGESKRYDNDQYASFDITTRLPALNGIGPLKGGKVYWEHAGTDLNAPWQGDGWGILIIDLVRTADIAGLYLSTAVTDLRFEYARTHNAWYRNGNYPQGYTYRGYPLGHHIGGDAQDWFFEVGRHFGPAWRASLSLDLEERGRSLPEKESRTEVGASIEARRIPVLGRNLEADVNLLFADVNDPLDDPDRDDRAEVYVGFDVSLDIW